MKKVMAILVIGMFLVTGTLAASAGKITQENVVSCNPPQPDLDVWPDSMTASGYAPGMIHFSGAIYIKNVGDSESTLDWTATISGNEGRWGIKFFGGEFQTTLSDSLTIDAGSNYASQQISVMVTDLPERFDKAYGTVTITGNGETMAVSLTCSQKRSRALPAVSLIHVLLQSRFPLLQQIFL